MVCSFSVDVHFEFEWVWGYIITRFKINLHDPIDDNDVFIQSRH